MAFGGATANGDAIAGVSSRGADTIPKGLDGVGVPSGGIIAIGFCGAGAAEFPGDRRDILFGGSGTVLES